MSVNARDLLVLHTNVNRLVGEEIFANKCLANNDVQIMNSIKKLIEAELLTTTNDFEVSIYKKTRPELQSILKSFGIKTTGNKPDLIKRIDDNFHIINNLDLPYVYIPTKKGEEILKKTEYLTSFIYSYKISLERAYYMVENYIDENCDDKVAEIYKFEFQRRYENGEFNFNDLYDFELNALIEHYTKKVKDYGNARKYSNIYLYLALKGFLEKLMNDMYSYYDNNGDINLNKIQNALNIMINHRASDIYERLIYNENLSNNIMIELFKKDTQDYSDLEEQLIEKFINYVVSYVKKESRSNTLIELSKMLEKGYTIDKEKFKKEDEYLSRYIITDINYLKNLESKINVAIDSRSGEIHLILDDDSLDILIQNQKYGNEF
ncbi:SAP domain-containing protein [Staphylococcus aureus]|uniref:SAP domain-containing protein n=1 Tax=Staphylococcus aureus TaxID=1280 RepID=A0A8G2I0M6_STAAU|nr:SAP domain-containing protein [Staphylococcus aureus]EFB49058.1 SAP domain-containing protein [Staphylococcus aureus subsp. aureus D139]EFC06614.1 SAP domain-containing protein [Staphylococcus aureus subsp. aureus H19]KIT72595.1 DNA-binding protein [Staphylococcus aureus]MBZ5404281.1 SAP domain-containing protein [Staphylococcus aureus]MBZ5422608.1 SAP domain-containing protein [Staphylococcus aureus]